MIPLNVLGNLKLVLNARSAPWLNPNMKILFLSRSRLFEKIDKLKYYTDVQPGYVFNMDVQDWSRQFVIVTEGPFDAISISGVSILGSEVNDTQRELIDNLNRKVIVVPDKDKAGSKLII